MISTDVAVAIEAVLFVSGEPVSTDHLRHALGCDESTLRAGLTLLSEQLLLRGIRLHVGRDGIGLVSAPELSGPVEHFLGIHAASRPSAASLETLSIVAYRQPVSRTQIEDIRGVGSERILRSLVAHGLIEEVGRGTGLGRPVIYGTTDEFLQRFGLESIDSLPSEDENPPAEP